MKQEVEFQNLGDGFYVIETYYLNRTGFTACYLLVDGDEAAVIETNTNHAVPFILGSLEQLGVSREQVKYVIVTHIHLDHAGGTGELMKHLPRAELIIHPRGKKHIIDPVKLIESVKEVYGPARYMELYGEIVPVPAERVKIADDGDEFRLGSRDLRMFHMQGHAKHHLVVLDKNTGTVLSGDNFGIGYPRMEFGGFRLVFPSTSPTQFDPVKALDTYTKIAALNPSRVLLTHYGAIRDIDAVHNQLKSWIEFSVEIAGKRYKEGYRENDLIRILEKDLWERFDAIIAGARGSGMTPGEREWLDTDTELNAQGLADYIQKLNTGPGPSDPSH